MMNPDGGERSTGRQHHGEGMDNASGHEMPRRGEMLD